MLDLSNISNITRTDLWREFAKIASDPDVKLLIAALTGAIASATAVTKAIVWTRKAVLGMTATKAAREMLERTQVVSFSKNEIRDAISGYVWPDASSIDPSDEADLRNVPVQGQLLAGC
ncbi:hypothetical protein [Paraburkholderia azotifigens]|uniref:Uncharacterized protein n=1 Tax=Paraburkholderia azotifigens TaxID=2057004 RepID=A0A5C6VCS5_9BURK|nr:hypothetical protein [Paraburkholderia azotifigens]TXC82386.1 hypothetical protein FRZ40_18030 [Paraburkholderia azotifigens]